MLSPIPTFVDRVRDRRCMVVVENSTEQPRPIVEYIIRIGSRAVTTVERALASLAAQTYQAIAIILVQFHPVTGLDAMIDRYRARFSSIRHIVVANNGSRSTAWWAGLNAVSAEFFGMLDDDDTLFPNHVASVMDRFQREPGNGFVYSGLIKVEDEPGHYVTAPQFSGPAGKIIEERREIFCLEDEDFRNLLPTHNVIGNHSWICRASLLDKDILTDPQLECCGRRVLHGVDGGADEIRVHRYGDSCLALAFNDQRQLDAIAPPKSFSDESWRVGRSGCRAFGCHRTIGFPARLARMMSTRP